MVNAIRIHSIKSEAGAGKKEEDSYGRGGNRMQRHFAKEALGHRRFLRMSKGRKGRGAMVWDFQESVVEIHTASIGFSAC